MGIYGDLRRKGGSEMQLKILNSGSKGNCYLLKGNSETLMIECGISFRNILKGLDFNIDKVVGAIVSHEHL